jgi:hemerythrin
MNIEDTLNERGSNYGNFSDFSDIVDQLTKVINDSPAYDKMDHVHKEGIRMIAHKIARILNGNPNYVDSWWDIAGYATLVSQHCKKHEESLKDIENWKVDPSSKPSDEDLDKEFDEFIATFIKRD